jgi:hypothetical protein
MTMLERLRKSYATVPLQPIPWEFIEEVGEEKFRALLQRLEARESLLLGELQLLQGLLDGGMREEEMISVAEMGEEYALSELFASIMETWAMREAGAAWMEIQRVTASV